MRYYRGPYKDRFRAELTLVDHITITPKVEIVTFNYRGLDFDFKKDYANEKDDWQLYYAYFKGEEPDLEAELEHIKPVFDECLEYLSKVDQSAR